MSSQPDLPEKVIDEGDLRKYFSQIPNLIDDTDLSPYAVRLYLRYKRTASENGKCTQSTSTLAEGCKMAAGTVVKARKELETAGLIKIHKVKNKHGGKDYLNVTVVDIWAKNFTKYSTSSYNELASSQDEVASSPGEIKKNTDNKNPTKKSEGASAPRDPSLDDPNVIAYKDIVNLSMNKVQRYEVFKRAMDTSKWRTVVTEWLGHGYNPKNVIGMIEVYEHGWQRTPGNGGKPSNMDKTKSYLKDWLEKE